MKLQILLDENNYIQSYLICEDSPGSVLNDSIEIDIEEDKDALYYIYDCYKYENNELILDHKKLNQEVNQEVVSREQELENRIEQLEQLIKSLVL